MKRYIVYKIIEWYLFIVVLICLLVYQILDAMNRDSGIDLQSIQVDGGMTANSLLMQLQADLVGIPVGKYLCVSTCICT